MPRSRPGRASFALVAFLAFPALLSMGEAAYAQTPDPIARLQGNPAALAQELLRSGMTPDQIRQRLELAGFPAAFLDGYLDPADLPDRVTITADQFRMLDRAGLIELGVQGLEPIPVDTGFVARWADSVRVAREVEEDEARLTLFGLEAFRGRSTLFQPVLSGPVPANYRIGPGDELTLVLTGNVEQVHSLLVSREGFIVIPIVGQIAVANLTMDDLTAVLRTRLGQSYAGILNGTVQFHVTVTRLRVNQVFVLGEVEQPGSFQLASVATVLNALYAAGGPSELANLRDIRVLRGNEVVATLDLYDYLLEGTATGDVLLEQGDRVFVPVRASRISVSGAVVRPAIFEVIREETLADALRMAGGLRPDARAERVVVHRVLPPVGRPQGPAARAAIAVPLGASVPPFPLLDGDSVVVDSVPSLEDQLNVRIAGAVERPGLYEWQPGMTLRDLVQVAGGSVVGADLREAEIARVPPGVREPGVLASTLRVPLDSTYLGPLDPTAPYVGAAGVPFPPAGSAPEVALEPLDMVTIFLQPDFEPHRSVTITGQVRYPGRYALTRMDERLSEVIDRAGGVTEVAFVEGARFAREREGAGPVNVDLARALAERGSRYDVLLQPGDSIHVPEYIPTVRVEGAVLTPRSVLYEPGRDVDYYVEGAGGYAADANKRRVSVRYANGDAAIRDRHLLVFGDNPIPGPGSVIQVPAKPPEGDDGRTLQVLSAVAQILASSVAIIAIAVR